MTDFLTRFTPGPTLGVAPAVLAGRAALATAAADLLAVPDAALERPWPWRGDAADVRYGLYRIFEATEAATGDLARALGSSGAPPRAPGARRVAPATVARWDLHGLVAGLDDASLDADPGAGEWSIRQTLAHAVSGQRGYGDYTAWWLARSQDDPDFPERIPPDAAKEANLPEESTEGEGRGAEILARLDALLDLAGGRFGGLDAEALGRRARWSGIAVDVGFRVGRWSSHLVEHTLQVDKTLAMLDRRPTEVARLVRLIHGAWGRLEALVFPIDPAAVAAPGVGGRSAADVLGELAREMTETARSVRAAAG